MVTCSDISPKLLEDIRSNQAYLLLDSELLGNNDALWIDGVGYIAQYHNWLDVLWEKGVPYFIRDYKFAELQTLINLPNNSKERKQKIKQLVHDVNTLNSKLKVYESCR